MPDVLVQNSASIPPKSLLWTPMPFVTVLFPFAGYCCLSNSKGVIYTFSSTGKIRKTINGSYLGKIVFSNKLKIDEKHDHLWDELLEDLTILYNRYEVCYTFWVHNCYSFVGETLAAFDDLVADEDNDPRYYLLRHKVVKRKPKPYQNVIKSFYKRPKSSLEIIGRYLFTAKFVSVSSGVNWWLTPLLIWSAVIAIIVLCILVLVK